MSFKKYISLDVKRIIPLCNLIFMISCIVIDISCIILFIASFKTINIPWIPSGKHIYLVNFQISLLVIIIPISLYKISLLFFLFIKKPLFNYIMIILEIILILYSLFVSVYTFIQSNFNRQEIFELCTQNKGFFNKYNTIDYLMKMVDDKLCTDDCPCLITNYSTYDTFTQNQIYFSESQNWNISFDPELPGYSNKFGECEITIKNEIEKNFNKYNEDNREIIKNFKINEFIKYWEFIENKFECSGWCNINMGNVPIFRYLFSDINKGVPVHNGCMKQVVSYTQNVLNSFGALIIICDFIFILDFISYCRYLFKYGFGVKQSKRHKSKNAIKGSTNIILIVNRGDNVNDVNKKCNQINNITNANDETKGISKEEGTDFTKKSVQINSINATQNINNSFNHNKDISDINLKKNSVANINNENLINSEKVDKSEKTENKGESSFNKRIIINTENKRKTNLKNIVIPQIHLNSEVSISQGPKSLNISELQKQFNEIKEENKVGKINQTSENVNQKNNSNVIIIDNSNNNIMGNLLKSIGILDGDKTDKSMNNNFNEIFNKVHQEFIDKEDMTQGKINNSQIDLTNNMLNESNENNENSIIKNDYFDQICDSVKGKNESFYSNILIPQGTIFTGKNDYNTNKKQDD